MSLPFTSHTPARMFSVCDHSEAFTAAALEHTPTHPPQQTKSTHIQLLLLLAVVVVHENQ